MVLLHQYLLLETMVIHDKIKMIKTKQIKTCRLDTLIRKNDIKIDDYNFWVIDLQGSELLALQGLELYYKNVSLC